MRRSKHQALFHRAYCTDCSRYLLQSFSRADVEQMAQTHSDLCNHETHCDTIGERSFETEGDYLLTREGYDNELKF